MTIGSRNLLRGMPAAVSELDRVRGTQMTLTLDIDAETADGFPEDVESEGGALPSSAGRPLASVSRRARWEGATFSRSRKKPSALWPSAPQRAGAGVGDNDRPFAWPPDIFGPRLACPKRHRPELQPIPEKTRDHAQFLLSSGRFEHCHIVSLEDRAGCRWVF